MAGYPTQPTFLHYPKDVLTKSFEKNRLKVQVVSDAEHSRTLHVFPSRPPATTEPEISSRIYPTLR